MGLLLLSVGCGRFLTRSCKHRHFSLNPITKSILLNFQIIASLHVEPEAVSGTEVSGQSEGCISSDGPSAVDDLVDPSRRYTEIFCKAILANAEWLQKIFQQDFARMNRRHFFLTLHNGLTFPDLQ